jgi:hypothetical protein
MIRRILAWLWFYAQPPEADLFPRRPRDWRKK